MVSLHFCTSWAAQKMPSFFSYFGQIRDFILLQTFLTNALHMLVFSSDWCGAIDLEVTAYNAIDSSWTVITA